MRGKIGALVATSLLLAVAAARADGGLSLTVSMPRIEEAPMTFTAAGVARGPDSFGDSMDYLKGAVLPQGKSCPPGLDEFGEIPGSILDTFDAFPVGPFNVTYRFTTDNGNLVAGAYRQCVYLASRIDDTVLASSQQEFSVREPQMRVRIVTIPRHIKFFYDTIGRPIARLVLPVKVSAEVPARKLLIGFKQAGARCTGNPDDAEFGGLSGDDGPRVKTGTHTYRVHPDLVMHPGRFPYGRRVRICALVAFFEESSNTYLLEGHTQATLSLRR